MGNTQNDISLNPNELPGKKIDVKSLLTKAIPYLGLIFVFVLFMIITGGELVSKGSLDTLLSQSGILMVVSVGAVFVYALGGMDLSIGAAVGVSAIAGAGVANAIKGIHPLLILLVCIIAGILTGLVNSLLSNLLNLPTFLGSLATLSLCGSITSAIVENAGVTGIRVRGGLWKNYDNFWVILGAFLVVLIVCLIFFNFTKVGKYAKAIGSNRICAEQSGVNLKNYISYAFLVSGFAIGVAAWLSIIRYNIVTETTGSGLQMDVILALVIGGMSITGGARSKISSAVIGALTLAFLSQGLTLAGVNATHIQTVRGVLFIVILAITCFRKRHEILPR